MKVLTIRQPWATLIMQQDKRFEFRSWKTEYRGELLIHAGKMMDKEAVERLRKYLPQELPVGKILGQAILANCFICDQTLKENLRKENKDIYAKSMFKEKFAWQLQKIKVFRNPIEIKGKLGL